MSDFGEEYAHVPLQCDSISAISVAKNPVLHSKTKHIEVRYNFLRDNVEKVSHLFFQRKPSANLYACQDQVSCI
jgi:hypothetical protein